MKKKKRVYICHTFYHAYIAAVKELNFKARGEATLVLSTMSNDFAGLKERAEATGLFRDVYDFDEQKETASKEVMAQHVNRGNRVANFFQRVRYTKLLGALQEEFLPVDLSEYEDIYVFCDSDPIGYYLNYKKLPYHAIEDGLNSGRLDDMARNSNRGAFPVKRLMAKTGLIFMPNGYSRYCIDYEVNDISANIAPPANIVERPRKEMYERLTKEDHALLVKMFLEDPEGLRKELQEKTGGRPVAMILTEPLCAPDVRERMFRDIIAMYENDYAILIKPHPRDVLDYAALFPEVVVMKGRFPMEVMNDIEDLQVDKLISVITQVENVGFSKEIVYLGLDFMDKYEAPEVHRKTELLWK